MHLRTAVNNVGNNKSSLEICVKASRHCLSCFTDGTASAETLCRQVSQAVHGYIVGGFSVERGKYYCLLTMVTSFKVLSVPSNCLTK